MSTVDTFGLAIAVGDRVRVTAYGSPVRSSDVGSMATVAGFNRNGRVVLEEGGWYDPIAGGRAVPGPMLGVMRRDGDDGYEANLDLYHAAYPHEPGRLYDCAACEARCHCTPAVARGEETECIWAGHEDKS